MGRPGAGRAPLPIRENQRTDIVQALLAGLPGLTQISPKSVAADSLAHVKIDNIGDGVEDIAYRWESCVDGEHQTGI